VIVAVERSVNVGDDGLHPHTSTRPWIDDDRQRCAEPIETRARSETRLTVDGRQHRELWHAVDWLPEAGAVAVDIPGET
jgi:hypothetical protein